MQSPFMNVRLLLLLILYSIFLTFKYCQLSMSTISEALKERWDKEQILLNHEMQWTVRFFKNKSEKWKAAASLTNISSGAKAYALRQEFRWKQMSLNSDD